MNNTVSFGQGPKDLVIIPGLSVKDVTSNAAALKGTFRNFTTDYTVHVIDRPAEVPEGTDNADITATYHETMLALGIRQADIIGISQGGMIAQYIAVRHPETVGKLVLGVTLARGNATSDAALDRWTELAESSEWEQLNADMYAHLFTPAFLTRHKEAFAHLARTVLPDDPGRFVRLVKACQSGGPYDELHKICCPTLVLGAENDNVVSAEASRQLARMTNAELYIFEGYGHGVYDETPEFYAKALEYLRKR